MQNLLNHRYQILKALGEGGFGKTFLAEDTQLPSRRRCVIKQLKLPGSQSDIVQLVKDRFAREAAVLEAVSKGNPQVPDLYAYFLENNQFYLVQEWIQGKSLNEIVPPAWSEARVISFLNSVLPALTLVHQHKIIHRDIKPDNIIVRQSDQQPCLIDFGAVKEMMNTVVTPIAPAASIVIGTAGFMAPEQASGRPTFASDLYSLGITAVYLLTGRSPQEIPIDSNTGQVLWQQYAPDVTAPTDTLLTRAIHLNPQDRYATAADMLAALNAPVSTPLVQNTLTSTPPISTAPVSSPSSSVVATSRSWKTPATIATLSILGLGAIALAMPLLQINPPISSEVDSQSYFTKTPIEDNAEEDSAERYYARAKKLYEEGRESSALDDIESALALDPAITEALALKGDILINQSRPDFEGAIAAYTQSLNTNPSDPEAARITAKRCSTYAKTESWTQAEADCTLSLQLDSDNAKTYAQRGDIFTAQNLFTQAEQDYTAAIDINEKNGTDDRSVYFRRANVRDKLGNPQGGLEDFERVRSSD